MRRSILVLIAIMILAIALVGCGNNMIIINPMEVQIRERF